MANSGEGILTYVFDSVGFNINFDQSNSYWKSILLEDEVLPLLDWEWKAHMARKLEAG